jgi:glycine dehydrogenase subunit 1
MYYSPITDDQKQYLLEDLGISDISELFKDLPGDPSGFDISIPGGQSELQIKTKASAMAGMNNSLNSFSSFLGGGSYHHFIPSVIKHLAQRGEIFTSYTPYQAEISQGSLRVIFEFQTMISELFGLPLTNASLYDGATALAEACVMAINDKRRFKILLPNRISPNAVQVMKTYLEPKGVTLDIFNSDVFYHFNEQEFKKKISNEYAAIVLPYPDFFGSISTYKESIEAAHKNDVNVIFSCDPMAMSLIKNPGELGADIAVGEGQCFGIPMAFGGPYLGLMAAKERFVRMMPGRIAGKTTDSEGNAGYVLTFQTREQHIKRGKALSNICSNQGLLAFCATVYLSYMGPNGLRRVAEMCYRKSTYLKNEISKIPGYKILNQGSTFKEFLISTPKSAQFTLAELKKHGILGGIDLSPYFSGAKNVILVAATEMNSQKQLDHYISTLKKLQ